MFSGQIYDVLVASEEDTRAAEDTGAKGAPPLRDCYRLLDSFAKFLPQLASVTAKKQGRRRAEQIEVATKKSWDLPLWAQPDFGFKLAGARRGEPGRWMLPGTWVPDGDEHHSSHFHPGPESCRECVNLVPRAVAVGLEQPAARALATGNPWAFTLSNRELVLMRFYRIDPSVRWLPAVHPGQVRVGVSYVALPVLPCDPEGAGASLSSGPSAAWQHRDLFALPWYKDAPAAYRSFLSYHLGLWVALMARLCAPDEEVGTGPPPVLNSWHRRYVSEQGWVHEAHYSTAVNRAPVELDGGDDRPWIIDRTESSIDEQGREDSGPKDD